MKLVITCLVAGVVLPVAALAQTTTQTPGGTTVFTAPNGHIQGYGQQTLTATTEDYTRNDRAPLRRGFLWKS